MSPLTWKERLGDTVPPALSEEIDVFATQIELKRQGKIDDKVFAETRLRRGAYGQRYDNGQRYDGQQFRTLDFESGDLTKGPATLWDAPGMQRIKIPFGRLTAEQMDVLADLAEEYSDAILHVTTRQDIQLHFVHIDDTVDLMRRLAAVGITTREACGNTVRNVTACPYSGVCQSESFDVSPYANALAYFLLGHKDTQDFGRKFKISFSGCHDEGCGLAAIHDIGLVARTRVGGDGSVEKGFEMRVGGGLGSVPQQARLFDEFVPLTELLPVSQAICRVFARLGEKENRARARLKFLVQKLGLEEFRRLVLEEKDRMPADERWTSFLDSLDGADRPLKEGKPLPAGVYAPAFEAWRRTNVRPQRQAGYVVATVRLPLGDLTSQHMRALADMARRYTGDTVRTTVEQNLVFRWLSEADLPAFYSELEPLGLAQSGAGTIMDITACPGTDTCKLGISSSRGLASVLEARLRHRDADLDPDVKKLHVKASGCFNACGQHHIADLGFLGVSRNVGGRRVAHFQIVLGGQWARNAGAYGLAIGAFPAKRIPEVLERITQAWVDQRESGEIFQAWVKRVGKAKIRQLLEDLTRVPPYEEDPSFYVDWGDAREYTIGDMGVGECAGEVVSLAQFGLSAAEREVFEAQLKLDEGDVAGAARRAYDAMLTAAKALIRVQNIDVTDDPDDVVGQFRTRFVETGLFADPYAKDKFAHYLFKTHRQGDAPVTDPEAAHHRIEEATLFIEAAHACHDRVSAAGSQAVVSKAS